MATLMSEAHVWAVTESYHVARRHRWRQRGHIKGIASLTGEARSV